MGKEVQFKAAYSDATVTVRRDGNVIRIQIGNDPERALYPDQLMDAIRRAWDQ